MASFSLTGFCQGFINFENVASATLKDKDGNKYGTGDLQRISGRISFPLSQTLNWRNQPTAWGLTQSASYNKNVDGEHKLYSSTMLRSGLAASLQVFEKASVYAGVGGAWKRSSRITDRNMKSFFKKFNDDTDRYNFGPSLRLSVGFRYGL